MIRKARIDDARQIHGLLNQFSKTGSVLPRSLSEIYDNLRDFYIYFREEKGDPIATCAIHICWENLAEIRSLAVIKNFEKRGIASRLVNTCLSEASELGIRQVFVLTYVAEFFKKFGFKEVEKSILPHKIWTDCLKCSQFPDCDETAMIIDL